LLSSFIKNGFILLAIGIVALYFILKLLGNAYQVKFSEEDRILLNQ